MVFLDSSPELRSLEQQLLLGTSMGPKVLGLAHEDEDEDVFALERFILLFMSAEDSVTGTAISEEGNWLGYEGS